MKFLISFSMIIFSANALAAPANNDPPAWSVKQWIPAKNSFFGTVVHKSQSFHDATFSLNCNVLGGKCYCNLWRWKDLVIVTDDLECAGDGIETPGSNGDCYVYATASGCWHLNRQGKATRPDLSISIA